MDQPYVVLLSGTAWRRTDPVPGTLGPPRGRSEATPAPPRGDSPAWGVPGGAGPTEGHTESCLVTPSASWAQRQELGARGEG